jgi:hypothetical protein
MKRITRARHLLAAPLLLLLVLTERAGAQTPDPSDIGRRPTPAARPRKARPAAKKRAVPPKRAAPRASPPRKPPKLKKLKRPKKPKKPRQKTHVARFYIGADLSFFPGAHTSRQIHGLGAETMPNTAAIRQLHGSSLRFIQGLHIMNSTMDVRFAVGLSNLIPVGGRRALWGSDLGLGAGIRIHRFGRVDLQIFNAYRLLVFSGLDRDYNGIGLHLEVGLGAAYRIDKRHWVEFRLGYCRQQLRYRKDTTAQVGGLKTPSGVVFKSHMIVISFAFLHFR